MSTVQLNVAEMTCNNCVKHVTDALNAVSGVEAIEVNLEKGKVTVKGSADSQSLVAALDAAGYPTTIGHDGETVCCGGCGG